MMKIEVEGQEQLDLLIIAVKSEKQRYKAPMSGDTYQPRYWATNVSKLQRLENLLRARTRFTLRPNETLHRYR